VASTRLLLARHGVTDWNRVGRWQGHADEPLNDEGRRQAAELAEQLADDGISAIYTSDLRRASETARIVARRLDLPVLEDAGLREIDVGSWSGLTRDEVRERFPDGFERWLGGEIGHDGETREQLTERVVSAVERIAARHDRETVLVVTHGGAIRALRRHAAGDPGEPIENCATVGLELVDGVLAVRTDDHTGT
jgi:broad specificity phosphatase PhoE